MTGYKSYQLCEYRRVGTIGQWHPVKKDEAIRNLEKHFAEIESHKDGQILDLMEQVHELEKQVKFHKDDAKRIRAYWRNNETPGGDFNMLDPNNTEGP